MDRHSVHGDGTPLQASSFGNSGTTTSSWHRAESLPSVSTQPNPDLERGASASSADPTPILTPQPSLVSAVNDAVGASTKRDAIDPNLIPIIAEQVVKHLQSRYDFGSAPFAPHQSQHIPQTPQSPDFGSVSSFPPLHTPPSPRRGSDDLDSNDRPVSPGNEPGIASAALHRQENSHLGDQATPSPENEATPRALRVPSRPAERGSEQRRDGSTGYTRSRSRGSDYSRPADSPLTRTGFSTAHEDTDGITSLEKAWQPLFEDGRATIRLGQFLRGLASYLIDDFEPKKSLVVTPAKMLRFFEETKTKDEVYPWSTIFGVMKHASISVMYRKLLCQHHFVQTHSHDQPSVPGLTPLGFEHLMTCLIQAHPDIEYQRLDRAVKDMPISNADDSRERFPKELPRRLFPNHGQVQAEQRLISSLNHEIALINLDHAAATMPPPPIRPPLPHSASVTDRDHRATHSPRSSQGSVALESEHVSPPAVQLERQRKPYVGKERSGKLYDMDETFEADTTGQYGTQYSNSLPSRPPQNPPGLVRSSSNKSSGRHYSFNGLAPDIRRKSTQAPTTFPPPLSGGGGGGGGGGGYSGSARRSSTPPRYNYSRSDPFGLGVGSSSALYTNNPQTNNTRDAPPGASSSNDARRYTDGRPLERARTLNDDERGRSKPKRDSSQGAH